MVVELSKTTSMHESVEARAKDDFEKPRSTLGFAQVSGLVFGVRGGVARCTCTLQASHSYTCAACAGYLVIFAHSFFKLKVNLNNRVLCVCSGRYNMNYFAPRTQEPGVRTVQAARRGPRTFHPGPELRER